MPTSSEAARPATSARVLAHPPLGPQRKGFGQRGDGLVGQPTLNVLGQSFGSRVAVFGLQGHRFQADRLQHGRNRRVDLPGTRELAPLNPVYHCAGIGTDLVVGKRRPACEQVIERGPQTVNVSAHAH